jgi:hypothetical protein
MHGHEGARVRSTRGLARSRNDGTSGSARGGAISASEAQPEVRVFLFSSQSDTPASGSTIVIQLIILGEGKITSDGCLFDFDSHDARTVSARHRF